MEKTLKEFLKDIEISNNTLKVSNANIKLSLFFEIDNNEYYEFTTKKEMLKEIKQTYFKYFYNVLLNKKFTIGNNNFVIIDIFGKQEQHKIYISIDYKTI